MQHIHHSSWIPSVVKTIPILVTYSLTDPVSGVHTRTTQPRALAASWPLSHVKSRVEEVVIVISVMKNTECGGKDASRHNICNHATNNDFIKPSVIHLLTFY